MSGITVPYLYTATTLYDHKLFVYILIRLQYICLIALSPMLIHISFFFFNDTAPTEIYPLPLHDALPIWPDVRSGQVRREPARDFDFRRGTGQGAEGGDPADEIGLRRCIADGGVTLGDAFARLIAAVVEVVGGHVLIGFPEQDPGRAQIAEAEFRSLDVRLRLVSDDRAVEAVTRDFDGALLKLLLFETGPPVYVVLRAHQHLLVIGEVGRELTLLEVFHLVGNDGGRVNPGRVGHIGAVDPAIPAQPVPARIREEILVVTGEHVGS